MTKRFRKRGLGFILTMAILTVISIAMLFLDNNSIAESSLNLDDMPLFLRDVFPDPNAHNIYQINTNDSDSMPLRFLCSIESYCSKNPESTVWLLFLDKSRIKNRDLAKDLQLLAEKFPNFRVAKFTLNILFEGTPLETLLHDDQIAKSRYLILVRSNLARASLIWKLGGFYSDLDVINFHPVKNFGNFVSLEKGEANNHVMHFSREHKFLMSCMKITAENFDNEHFGATGSRIFVKVLKRNCPDFQGKLILPEFTEDLVKSGSGYIPLPDEGMEEKIVPWESVEEQQIRSCLNMIVLDKRVFSPLGWKEVDELFKEPPEMNLSELLMFSHGVHFFNDETKGRTIRPGSGSALDIIAAKYCPVVYHQAVRSKRTL